MTDQLRLPPKKDVALALIQTEDSVYVHLDPRVEGVLVPPWLRNQPQLVLQLGLRMAVQIPDLEIGDEAVSCTLSFNRRPEYCYLPYEAIFGLVGEGGRGMIWPDSVPPEVAAQAPGRAAAGKASSGKKRAHLSAVPDVDASASDEGSDSSSSDEQGESAKQKDEDSTDFLSPEQDEGPRPPLQVASGSAVEERALPADQNSSISTDEATETEASESGAVAESGDATQTGAPEKKQRGSRVEATKKPAPGGAKRELPPYLRIVK